MNKILFEAIPPCRSWGDGQVGLWIDQIMQVIENLDLKHVFIPEIVPEERRPILEEKMGLFEFICLLQKKKKDLRPIVTKVVTKVSEKELFSWVDQAIFLGVDQIVLVGQEEPSSFLSVEEAAVKLKKRYPQLLLGGIVIFSRLHEPMRVALKMRAGLEFFVSQIIFEEGNLKHFLAGLVETPDWQKNCDTPFFISISPPSDIGDLHFLKKLGVEFPASVFADLTDPVYEHSIQEYDAEIKQIIDGVEEIKKTTRVKLGYNVEHVTFHNLPNAKKWLQYLVEK